MKKLFIVLISMLYLQVQAQNRVLELEAQKQENNSVEISYKKYNHGTYCIAISFNSLTNTDKPYNTSFNVNNSHGNLLTLKPNNKDQGIGYGYRY